MEQLLKCFCVGMQSPEVKQTAVKRVTDVYSTVIVKIFYDLFKHHTEKDAEQSWCQNTTLFHTVDNGEGSKEVAVQPTWSFWSLCCWITMLRNFGGQPRHSMIIHNPFLLTMSNALIRSTNATYSPLFCSLHFFWSCLRTNTMSVVPPLV